MSWQFLRYLTQGQLPTLEATPSQLTRESDCPGMYLTESPSHAQLATRTGF